MHHLCFTKNLLERIWKLIMTSDKIRDWKMQHDINIEAAKVSVLLSETIDKYQYLTGEERLPSDQRTLREKA